ncbi:MAG: hypothetical protein H6Q37_663 [Chloroflexi bacterium]|nr:hypothetical protein [Chloroflexota bacterium]
MARKSPGEVSSSSWRQVLTLGERLYMARLDPRSVLQSAEPPLQLKLNDITSLPDRGVLLAQRMLIIASAAGLANSQVDLWLPDWLGQEMGYINKNTPPAAYDPTQQTSIFSEIPPTRLERRALKTRQICFGYSDKKVISLAIPLLSPAQDNLPETILGILRIYRPNGPAFRRAELEIWSALATQSGLALQTGRQLALERRRFEQLTAITEVGNAITSILDPIELLQGVADLIHDRFGFPYVHLFSVHPGRRRIFFEAGSGERSLHLAEQSFTYDMDDPQGMIPWVAQHGEPALANDVSLEERYRPAPLFPQNTRSELSIPLKFGNAVLGVLDIQSDVINAFGKEEIFLFEALADDIAIAMRNASLYRSEQWRRQVADGLREVAGLLSAEVSLDEMLAAILVELERSLPCDLAAIWFLEEEAGDSQTENQAPPLRLAALRGPIAVWLEPQIGLNLDEILEINGAPDTAEEARLPEWLISGLQTKQPVTRSNNAAPDLIGALLEFPNDYSAVAAALHVGDKRLGLLTLLHHTANRYGGEASAMAATFASYASVAIQNARLFEAAHEQVWVSTVLLQVAEATQSLDDLTELLVTVVNITPTLAGVKTCAIYLAEEDGIFFPAAASGLLPEAQIDFERRFFAPGDLPALDHLWADKHPTVLQREGDDLRLASLFPPEPAKGEALEFLVLVPLLGHGEVLGALFVQYISDPLAGSIEALENFFEERLAILQGIAHQTAAAVDNIRLLKSQKEEAYVSVALLQVAQAVVSSNDLNESLGAVVRITPILTGVKRVAIYLYDPKSVQFRLAQSYGLPRDAAIYPYGIDEFPLLAVTLERNKIMVVPVDSTSTQDWEDVPDIWTCQPALESEQVEKHLADEARLVMTLPLTVMGEVLGVMLVEEPKPQEGESFGGSISNLRLRPKRLEIITGISQQAALAIQNDQLKKEMQDRERLEREMQLAREIQRTFLPGQLPELPGWELTVWWRTAREVGGDFYDLINLPDGHLGLVIADVADKGVPAALFMVLARALVRASAKESSSPAEVLEQVNDLLAPDAQGGMFVTLFYAILDPNTGTIIYSNAGHNPPILAHQGDQTITLLTRTGMALGVQEGSPIEECQCVVETAFGGPMNALEITENKSSAKSMLQAIDAAIESFTEGIPPADDSTVLILYRNKGKE